LTEFTFHVANRTPIACHRERRRATEAAEMRLPFAGQRPTGPVSPSHPSGEALGPSLP
jgi:hypothetical protein